MTPYDRCLAEMYGLRRFGIKLGLDVIRGILDAIGNPQDRFRSIHIAGTNGKGSVAATLDAVLRASGHSTGLYTSPHLVRFNERIAIDGTPIDDAEVVAGYEAVRTGNRSGRDPTFFEFSTAMAFHAFGSRGVEWAVIETGMGGRLDATNVLDPRVSVITNISLEHRSYLGDTIAAIAGEKAGIIKPGRPALTAATQPDALRVLEQTAQEKQAPLYRKGRDFRIRRKPDGTFHYFGDAHRWRNLRTALEGPHQADNAALALAACERLIESGVPISEDAIRSGLKGTRWPGRLEVVMKQPLVILDGAHNLMAARNLARYLEHRMKGRRLSLVIGILDDKPADAMLAALLPMADRVFVTQARIDRAIPAEVLARRAERRHADVTVIPDVARAVAAAVDGSGPQDAVCIAGSLYVVGEAVPAVERIAPGRGPEARRTG